MAALTRNRRFASQQRSLLDPPEDERPARRPLPRTAPAVAAPEGGPRFAGGKVTPPATAPAAATPRTFDDVVTSSWEGLVTTHAATCLLCGAAMRPRFSAGPRPVAATCTDCGSTLS